MEFDAPPELTSVKLNRSDGLIPTPCKMRNDRDGIDAFGYVKHAFAFVQSCLFPMKRSRC